MAADPATSAGRAGKRMALPLVAAVLGAIVAGGLLLLGTSRGLALGCGVVAIVGVLWIGSLLAAEPRPAADERTRRQRQRSTAIALALGALVVMFYVATLVRLGPNALRKDGLGQPGAGNKIPASDPLVCKRTGAC